MAATITLTISLILTLYFVLPAFIIRRFLGFFVKQTIRPQTATEEIAGYLSLSLLPVVLGCVGAWLWLRQEYLFDLGQLAAVFNEHNSLQTRFWDGLWPFRTTFLWVMGCVAVELVLLGLIFYRYPITSASAVQKNNRELTVYRFVLDLFQNSSWDVIANARLRPAHFKPMTEVLLKGGTTIAAELRGVNTLSDGSLQFLELTEWRIVQRPQVPVHYELSWNAMAGVARQVVPDAQQATPPPVMPADSRAGDTLRLLASDISSVRYWFQKIPEGQAPAPQVSTYAVTGAVSSLSADDARRFASELPPIGPAPEGDGPATGV